MANTEARDTIRIEVLEARVAEALDTNRDDLSEEFAEGALSEDVIPTSADYLTWLIRRALSYGVSITP